MPIYEYQCSNCHHLFDVIQKINDEPVKECSKCHKETAVKLVSAAGFQLKGTGWYATDFKDKKSPASTAKPAETAKPTETTSATTAESSKTSKGGSE